MTTLEIGLTVAVGFYAMGVVLTMVDGLQRFIVQAKRIDSHALTEVEALVARSRARAGLRQALASPLWPVRLVQDFAHACRLVAQ